MWGKGREAQDRQGKVEWLLKDIGGGRGEE